MSKKALVFGVILILIIVAASLSAFLNQREQILNQKEEQKEQEEQNPSQNQEEVVILDTIKSDSTVSSPLTITGKAKGQWFFEASFPVKLVDANGKIVAQAPAQAKGEWMTTDYVPFSVTLTFTKPATSNGTLILQRDNPSGLPENDQSISVPVKFGTGSVMTNVKLYYQNVNKSGVGDVCSQETLVPVNREIISTKTPIQDAVKLLIQGDLTSEERAQGFTTEFPNDDFRLVSANLKSGTLTLEFTEVPGFTGGGSCRITILAGQIIKTVKQFPDVKKVVFKPDEIFQP